MGSIRQHARAKAAGKSVSAIRRLRIEHERTEAEIAEAKKQKIE